MKVKVPLELTRTAKSGFRSLLSLLLIDRNATILDIGAGGLGGEQTTDHLVEFFDGRIIGFQPAKVVCDKLQNKYQGRVEAVHGFYGECRANVPFDLIVFDIRPHAQIYERLLDVALADGLTPGGYAICTSLSHLRAAYEREPPMFPPEERRQDEEFGQRFFGADDVTADVARAKFEDHPHYEFVTIIDKWMGEVPLTWVVLRRKLASKESGKSPLRLPPDLTRTRAIGLRAIFPMLPHDERSTILRLGGSGDFGDIEADLAGVSGADRMLDGLGEHALSEPFDVVILAPVGAAVPSVWKNWVFKKSLPGLLAGPRVKQGGHLVAGIVYNVPEAYDGAFAYFPGDQRADQADFMREFFGAETVNAASLSTRFSQDRDYEFLGLVDRWLDLNSRGLGWVILRRRSRPAPTLTERARVAWQSWFGGRRLGQPQ